ncbi:hypothetical protein HDU97_001380 [Phlyctochytrium planicorne]|nr:hypothetical protein HDU97_001380 [Phlyctochytrium planicorne]
MQDMGQFSAGNKFDEEVKWMAPSSFSRTRSMSEGPSPQLMDLMFTRTRTRWKSAEPPDSESHAEEAREKPPMATPQTYPNELSTGHGKWPAGALVKVTGCDILRNGKIVEDESLWIQDGRICDPREIFFRERKSPDFVVDLSAFEEVDKVTSTGVRKARADKRPLVVPGFIDIQINGSFGYDFADADHIEEAVSQVAIGLLKLGVTSFLPTIVTSDTSTNVLKILPKLQPRKGSAKNGAEVLGAHLEGPFISPLKPGAHDKQCIRSAPQGFKDVASCYGFPLEDDGTTTAASTGVRLVTLAPEVEGISNAIGELTKRGIVVAMGHTAVSVDEAEKAVQSGVSMITHLFNAMQPFHHRDPGPVGLVGSSPESVSVERPYYGVIADGIHVHPSSVRIAYRSHPSGAILVTDAISPAGIDVYDPQHIMSSGGSSPPPESYLQHPRKSISKRPKGFWLGKLKVLLRNQNKEVVLEGTETLAGSVLTMPQAIRNLMIFTGCSLAEAVNAATIAPAAALGILERKGSLTHGADADFVVLDNLHGPDGPKDFRISRVFVAGNEVTCLRE